MASGASSIGLVRLVRASAMYAFHFVYHWIPVGMLDNSVYRL